MKWIIYCILILGLAIFAGRIGCGPEPEKEIKIGVILPLTGDGSAYGQKEKNGIELAITKTNETGGIEGKQIRVIYEDSKGIPTPAVSALNKLITKDKVKAVIGGAFSSPTLAMLPLIDKNKVIMISPTASSPDLSNSSEYFFRVWPSDVTEGSITAKIGINRMKLKTFAVLHGNNDYGLGLNKVFKKTVEEHDGNVLIVETYNEGDTDFRAQLTKIKKFSPEAIYLAGYYKEFTKILIQSKEMGIKSQFLSCGTFHEPEIIKNAGTSAEGVVFVQPYFDKNSDDLSIQDFVKHYENKFGVEAGVYAAHGYDAMMVLIEAIKIGGISSDGIKDALLSLKDFHGVTGKTTFIKGGDVIKPFRVMSVKNGEFIDFEY